MEREDDPMADTAANTSRGLMGAWLKNNGVAIGAVAGTIAAFATVLQLFVTSPLNRLDRHLSQRFDTLERHVDGRFDTQDKYINQRFGNMEQHLKDLQGGVAKNEKQLDSLRERIQKIELQQKMQSQSEDTDAPRFNAGMDTSQFDTRVANLNFRVLRIDTAEGFSNEDAEAIIVEIKSLHSQQPDIESRNKLRFAIETAATSFVRANRPDFVYRLEELEPAIFQTNGSILQLMVQVLGNRLLADVDTPQSWKRVEGRMKKTYENYQKYADRAKINGYPEIYLAYEMLLRFVEEEGQDEIILKLIDDLSTLNDQDAENFDGLMMVLLNEDSDFPGGKRIANQVKDFLCRFKEQSPLLFNVFNAAELECSSI